MSDYVMTAISNLRTEIMAYIEEKNTIFDNRLKEIEEIIKQTKVKTKKMITDVNPNINGTTA